MYHNKKEDIPDKSHPPQGNWDLLNTKGSEEQQTDLQE
jgi:hypothetical protein